MEYINIPLSQDQLLSVGLGYVSAFAANWLSEQYLEQSGQLLYNFAQKRNVFLNALYMSNWDFVQCLSMPVAAYFFPQYIGSGFALGWAVSYLDFPNAHQEVTNIETAFSTWNK